MTDSPHTAGTPDSGVRYLRVKGLPAKEYDQLVYCPNCKVAMKIRVQNPRGSHGHQCGSQMEVYIPRPGRWGGLHG